MLDGAIVLFHGAIMVKHGAGNLPASRPTSGRCSILCVCTMVDGLQLRGTTGFGTSTNGLEGHTIRRGVWSTDRRNLLTGTFLGSKLGGCRVHLAYGVPLGLGAIPNRRSFIRRVATLPRLRILVCRLLRWNRHCNLRDPSPRYEHVALSHHLLGGFRWSIACAWREVTGPAMVLRSAGQP